MASPCLDHGNRNRIGVWVVGFPCRDFGLLGKTSVDFDSPEHTTQTMASTAVSKWCEHKVATIHCMGTGLQPEASYSCGTYDFGRRLLVFRSWLQAPATGIPVIRIPEGGMIGSGISRYRRCFDLDRSLVVCIGGLGDFKKLLNRFWRPSPCHPSFSPYAWGS